MNRNEVFNEGPTTSQHVEANSDDQFKNSTYKLKRTRSMGGFDDFLLKSSTNSTVSSSSSGNNTIINSNNNSSSTINNNNDNNNNDNSNSNTSSANPNDKKLTSRDFISDKTLKKLNIPASTAVNYYDDLESVPSFYRSVMGTSKSKSLKNNTTNTNNNNNNNNNNTSNGILSPESISSVNDSVLTDYSSEDSMSSINSTNSNIVNNLIPKHQLKKQQQLQQSASTDINNSNNDDSNNDNHHEQQQQQHLISNVQLHDDIDVQYSPEQHVDYLSHDWDESEISKSWRYVIMKRNDFANAARLENASWRTWAQTRNGLKTISPAELNWI
ncbi:unnamed protein product [[Candida] boidinii]|nr:unnamed protein product [[Candida] boidinii]